MKRVVITGMSAITALGSEWKDIYKQLKKKENTVKIMPEWQQYEGLQSYLASPIEDFELPSHYTRKKTRSMGKVALLATRATECALLDAKLLDDTEIKTGAMGIAYGSSSGSPDALKHFLRMHYDYKVKGINANTYLQMMPQTTAVNIGVFFQLKGRIIPVNSACTSGSQSIGYAYESIKYGLQSMMIAGGAEELDITQVAIFNTLLATSTQNDSPKDTPRPFDKMRDGLVLGEGACTLILEEREHAIARGAPIYAEITGYHSNSDGTHITQPNVATMQVAMQQALDNAGISANKIAYINAHGTATERGDIAESQATYNIFSDQTPISSLKSYLGHTLGACGAIESYISIQMMNENWFCPTLNLDNPDNACAHLAYIRQQGCQIDAEYIMNNNFAFGGINTSLIFKRWH